MSDQDIGDARTATEFAAELKNEPHPVDLLASLTRADSGLPAASASKSKEQEQGNKEPGSKAAPAMEPLIREENLPAAARALAAQQGAGDANDPTAMQRTMAAIRNALPLVQKLLPLLDGNILGAILGMVGPHLHAQPAPKPLDFTPMENGLAEIKKQHQELKGQFQMQDAAMKRLAEQLDQVREATERNTREQEDLVEELRMSGKRVNIVAFMAFALLAASIAMNVVLYLQIHRLLP